MADNNLSISEETKIVALIARGDSYPNIKKIMLENGRSVSEVTIGKVKKRNLENLNILKERMLIKQEEDAASIKQEANQQLSERLKLAKKAKKVLDKAQEDYLSGEIGIKEYKSILDKHKDISVTELVSLSKEMHNQSVEAPPPTASPDDMATLIAAIKSGDEVKLNQIVFNKNG